MAAPHGEGVSGAADGSPEGRPMGVLELAGVYGLVLRAVFTTELGASGRSAAMIVVERLGGCPVTVPRRRISEGGRSEDGAQEDIASEDCF